MGVHMKTSDALVIGGLGIAAYLLLKNTPTSPTTTQPPTPLTIAKNLFAQSNPLLTAAMDLSASIAKGLFPSNYVANPTIPTTPAPPMPADQWTYRSAVIGSNYWEESRGYLPMDSTPYYEFYL